MNNCEYKTLLNELRCAVVIPTYNNADTVMKVIQSVLEYCNDVIVVNDGSTDGTTELLADCSEITLISYEQNCGKGYALKEAFKVATSHARRYVITLDADDQHSASDIPAFIEAIQADPDSLLVGERMLDMKAIPGSNRFANRFSNFWFWAETGIRLKDTQSGYRLYPIEKMKRLIEKINSTRYEFEVEILVRAAWKSIPIHNVPIHTIYPKNKVTHFRPLRDFLRISLLNSLLVLYALLVYFPIRFIKAFTWANTKAFIAHNITHSRDSNRSMAAAIGLGFFWGTSPFWGYHMILAGVSSHFLRLNKVLAIAASNVSIPPMIPVILYISFILGCWILGEPINFTLDTIGEQSIGQSLLKYVVGSLTLGVTGGFSIFILTYLLLTLFRKQPKIKK